jgi:hypothetical protein
VGEGGSLTDQTIKVRGLDLTVAKGGNAVGPELIRENKEDVGAMLSHFISSLTPFAYPLRGLSNPFFSDWYESPAIRQANGRAARDAGRRA